MPGSADRRILAVTPGAEALAFAVAEGDRLLYYGARTLETDRNLQLTGEKAVAAVEAAIEDFSPDCLTVMKVAPDGSQPTRRDGVINDRIRAIALRRALNTYRVARAAVRKAVTGDPEASREEIAETLVDAYPQLQTFAEVGIPGPDEHAADVFEAVGLAVAARRAHEKQRRKVL